MVQLAVQTGKSTTLTSKLSMGISKQLKEADARLISNLSPQIYNIILHDFRLYMKIRSDLYKAIAQKYYGKMSKSQEKNGECIVYFKTAVSILKHIEFPKKKNQK